MSGVVDRVTTEVVDRVATEIRYTDVSLSDVYAIDPVMGSRTVDLAMDYIHRAGNRGPCSIPQNKAHCHPGLADRHVAT